MITTDLYGFQHEDVDSARASIESALAIRLEGHDSMYIGEYFRGSLSSGPSLQLRRNADPLHDPEMDPPQERFAEPRFPSSPLLLFVRGSDIEALRESLPQRVAGLSFLTRSETE